MNTVPESWSMYFLVFGPTVFIAPQQNSEEDQKCSSLTNVPSSENID